MSDILIVNTWEIEAGDISIEGQAFLDAGGFVGSPEEVPSLQYRDAATGSLLAIRPFSESADYAPGGPDADDSDFTYGPGAGAVRDGFLYLCGWDSYSVWKLDIATAATVWRIDGEVTGQPDPPFMSSAPGPVLSADGTKLFVTNDNPGTVVWINTSDGSVSSTQTVSGSPSPYQGPNCFALHPDGSILFGNNSGVAANHGIYKLNVTTGAVTPFLMLSTLGLPNTLNYLNVFHMAPHPGGDGFAFTVMHYDGSYHSKVVECSWAGTVSCIYTYGAPWDGERLVMVYALCYSTDGDTIYAVADTSWPIIWRWDRSAGPTSSVANPWAHTDYNDPADWVADGRPHYGQANHIWYSLISGIACYDGVPPSPPGSPSTPAWVIGAIGMKPPS